MQNKIKEFPSMVTLESTRTYLHTNLTLKLDPVLTSSLEKRAAIFSNPKVSKNQNFR